MSKRNTIKTECRQCLFFKHIATCERCVRHYSHLEDLFTDSKGFNESGGKVSDNADEWPDNLYRKVFDISKADYKERPLNLLVKMTQALSMLEERERYVLTMRYTHKLPLSAVGESLKVSSERVRQIEAKAIRRLRHPMRKKVILYGVSEASSDLPIATPSLREEDGSTQALNTRPIEAIGLSSRSRNALRRNNIEYVGDLVKLSLQDIENIPSLGEKSIDDITTCLNQYGLSLSGHEE